MNTNNTHHNIRGKINHIETQVLADRFFHDHIDPEDVRLLSFIDYCIKNGGKIDTNQLTVYETETIQYWCDCRYLEYIDDTHLKCISKEFYDITCQILWDSYVNL